jgi:hypothetical protein
MKKYKTMAAMCFLLNMFIWSLATAQSKLPPCQDMAGALNNCYGTQTFQGGASYVGEFKENKRNGQGTYIFPNGNKYVGEFRDDQMNGQGTLYLATGAKYSGGWKNGKYDGYGTYTHPDSRPAISGIFEDDKFIRAEKAPLQKNTASAEPAAKNQKNSNSKWSIDMLEKNKKYSLNDFDKSQQAEICKNGKVSTGEMDIIFSAMGNPFRDMYRNGQARFRGTQYVIDLCLVYFSVNGVFNGNSINNTANCWVNELQMNSQNQIILSVDLRTCARMD